MKSILFVINTLGVGGAERAMLDLFVKLDPKEYEISLYVLTAQGDLVGELPDNVKLLNRKFNNCSVLTDKGRKVLMKLVLKAGVGKALFIRRAPYLLKCVIKMKKNGRIQPDKLCWRLLSDAAPRPKKTYDLAVAYLEGGSTYYVADHVKAKKKAAFVHIDYGKAGYFRELDKGCYQNFDKIFAVSDEVKEHFLRVYPEYENEVSIFQNRIDRKRILSLSQEPGGFDDQFNGYRILTVGRLTAQKSYDVAIKAMALLKKQGISVRWYVLGEGELHDTIVEWIQQNHLEEDFILLGVKKNPYPYYRMSDLYVHATAFEGKSIAIQEAQVLGIPVLATDCSGNREQIEDGKDGRLCEFNEEKISNAILWMLTHPDECKAYAQMAKKRVSDYSSGLDEFLSLMKK